MAKVRLSLWGWFRCDHIHLNLSHRQNRSLRNVNPPTSPHSRQYKQRHIQHHTLFSYFWCFRHFTGAFGVRNGVHSCSMWPGYGPNNQSILCVCVAHNNKRNEWQVLQWINGMQSYTMYYCFQKSAIYITAITKQCLLIWFDVLFVYTLSLFQCELGKQYEAIFHHYTPHTLQTNKWRTYIDWMCQHHLNQVRTQSIDVFSARVLIISVLISSTIESVKSRVQLRTRCVFVYYIGSQSQCVWVFVCIMGEASNAHNFMVWFDVVCVVALASESWV